MTITPSNIHPTAIVEDGATIGSSCKIGPYCCIGSGVTLDDNVFLESHVVISGNTFVGKGTKIWPFSSVGSDPQDLKYLGEATTLIIGQNNLIRECVSISTGADGGGGITRIGNDCLFMLGSHVGHDCKLGDNIVIANNSAIAGHVIIEDNVNIGGLVGVHQFCRIGSHSFVAGGSLVRKDVPPFVKAAREPLSYVGINSVGLRRRGFDIKKVHEIQNIYRILFQKKYNNTQAMEIIQGELNATPERDEIIQFIENSQRGIMKGYFQRN
jgi:UDP-N-acetylglucosamine acyltransferase